MHAGREQLVLEHVARAQLLDRSRRRARGMRDGRELAAAADPDVARLVAPSARGTARRPARSRARRGSDPSRRRTGFARPASRPVIVHQVGTEHAAQRHERHALLGRLQRGVHAGQVASFTLISPFSTASVKRGARPASPSDTALDSHFGDAARADQQVGATARAPARPAAAGFALRRISARTTAIAGIE